jgi:hypothetical protein
MGTEIAWLGSSVMGKSLYESMRFSDLGSAYREYEST